MGSVSVHCLLSELIGADISLFPTDIKWRRENSVDPGSMLGIPRGIWEAAALTFSGVSMGQMLPGSLELTCYFMFF